MSGELLQPGQEIRPKMDEEVVRHLTEKLYGLSIDRLEVLAGYDDRNYKIVRDVNIKNPLIEKDCPHGYVLKVMNSMDSKKLSFVECQNEVMNFLNSRSIHCPKPIRNVFGHYYSVEKLPGSGSHVVRLLEYLPGELVKDVERTPYLFYQVGEFVAQLDNILKGFYHSGLDNHQHIWMLEKVPELVQFKSAIKDQAKLELVEEVIEEFKYAVVPRMAELERGVIHGDCNEQNILATRKDGSKDYRISGILDFGDMQVSHYLFELAITITYMILMTGDPRTGGYVLAGYTINRILPDQEYRLLKTCVCARLVQSLVLGAYTHQQQPDNTYVLSTEKANGWSVLEAIRRARNPEDTVDPTDWKAIADEYLTRSYK